MFRKNLKIFLRCLLSHYPVLAALFTVVFTAICLGFGEVFLASFSIDYFSFGGITDAYQIPVSNGVISFLVSTSTIIVFTFSIFISALQIKNEIVSNSDDLSLKDKFKYLTYYLFPISGCVLSIFMIKVMLIDLPANKAEEIKNGFSERYNIHTKDEEYICQSIVGGTSQYIFLWNYKEKRPLVMARSHIKILEQIIPSSPSSIVIQNYKTPDKEFEIIKNNLKVKQEAWSLLLSEKCSQVVVWKDIRHEISGSEQD